MTLARMIRVHKLDTTPHLPGLREMEPKDISEVADLFARYMQRFGMSQMMSIEEIQYIFLSGRGDMSQPSQAYRRPKQVLWAYVVEVRSKP